MTGDTFASRFVATRTALGLTRADVAKRMQVTVGYIWQIESGHRIPELGQIYKIAVTLGVNPHALDAKLVDKQC